MRELIGEKQRAHTQAERRYLIMQKEHLRERERGNMVQHTPAMITLKCDV